MIQQEHVPPPRIRSNGLVWEVRHAGLLGIKYEVAVRSDLFTGKDGSIDYDVSGQNTLNGIVDSSVLGYVASLGPHIL